MSSLILKGLNLYIIVLTMSRNEVGSEDNSHISLFQDYCSALETVLLIWSFCITDSLSILGTSFKPLASNHGAFAQSNPFPNVLSGEVIYQWHEESGTSTAHFDQSLDHWGTCTQRIDEIKNEKKLNIHIIIHGHLDF